MLDLTQCYEHEFEYLAVPGEPPIIIISEAENKNISKTARICFYEFLREYLKAEKPEAAYALGLFYRYRKPCGEWLLRTMEYWTFAAEKGEWRAAWFLYQLFYYGEGNEVEPNPERAFMWLLKCYEAHPEADIGNILARRYFTGNGTERDPSAAQELYIRGAAQGDVRALEELKSLTEALDDAVMGLDMNAVETHCREELFKSCGVKFRDD